MKKIFTLIAAAAMALSANAFTDTWKSASTATSPVSTTNVKVTFNNDNDGTWSFSNSYASGNQNGMSVTIEPTAAGNFTIFLGGNVSTGKKLHMQDGEGTGLTATLASNPTVTIDDNTNPPSQINSGDGLVYTLEANKSYTFSISGTSWRFASYKFTNEKVIIYDTEWNFSTWDDEDTGFSNQVKNNLGLFACYKNAETQITNFGKINSSSKGGYTKRFQLGGGGAALKGTGTPTQRFVYFNVKGNADISVQCVSGGSGERILYITDGTNILTQFSTTSNLEEVKATYTGNAGVIYIYGSSAINIYDIKATNVGTTVLLDDTTKPTGIETLKVAKAAFKGATYNVAGQQVSAAYKGLVIKDGKKFVNK